MTGDQVREARRLLGWSADSLAPRCRMPAAAILAFEQTGKMSKPQGGTSTIKRMELLKATLEAAGVIFTGGETPSVKLFKQKAWCQRRLILFVSFLLADIRSDQ